MIYDDLAADTCERLGAQIVSTARVLVGGTGEKPLPPAYAEGLGLSTMMLMSAGLHHPEWVQALVAQTIGPMHCCDEHRRLVDAIETAFLDALPVSHLDVAEDDADAEP